MQNALLIRRGGLQTWPRKAHLPDFCFVARSWACAVLFWVFYHQTVISTALGYTEYIMSVILCTMLADERTSKPV